MPLGLDGVAAIFRQKPGLETFIRWVGWCGNVWQAAIVKFEEICDVQLQPGIVTSFGCIADVSEGPASRYLYTVFIDRYAFPGLPYFQHFCWN